MKCINIYKKKYINTQNKYIDNSKKKKYVDIYSKQVYT